MAQATVQDADEAVAQGAQGLVVAVAGGDAVVVVGPGSRASAQTCEGPGIDRVIEAAV